MTTFFFLFCWSPVVVDITTREIIKEEEKKREASIVKWRVVELSEYFYIIGLHRVIQTIYNLLFMILGFLLNNDYI